MPIIDIEIVCESKAEFATGSARELADAIGHALGSEPGHTWVRLRFLASAAYAENQTTLERADLPAFVTVLHAHLPSGEALASEAMALTLAVAKYLARDPGRVHVQYAPAAAGRQAFGGKLVG